MPKSKVLDSWALISYFQGEPAGKKVMHMLETTSGNKNALMISRVNWGEVLYVIEGRYGAVKRDDAEHVMDQMNLEVVELDEALTRTAAHLKAADKLPYGDAFAAALALREKTPLVTGDKDFKAVENKILIDWIN